MKCTACGQECFENEYPEVIFSDSRNCICENCSIDYEEVDGKIELRKEVADITEQTELLNTAIDRLMENDSNASWDECESVDELRECLIEAMSGYEPTEETYIFCADVLQSIGNHQ